MRTDKRETLLIGYKKWDFRFVDKIDRGNALGECEHPASKHNNTKGHIRIAKGMHGIEKANTILHEINHAIFYSQGLHMPDDVEEQVVLAMTNGFIQFAKDNPKFVKKILRLIESDRKPGE